MRKQQGSTFYEQFCAKDLIHLLTFLYFIVLSSNPPIVLKVLCFYLFPIQSYDNFSINKCVEKF